LPDCFSNNESGIDPASMEVAPVVKKPRRRKEECGFAVSPHSKELDLLARKLHGWRGDKALDAQLEKRLISTGSWDLDIALARIDPVIGNGGFAQRQFIEVSGDTSVGKSNLSDNFMVQCEKAGKFVVLVATEEPAYPRMLRTGVHLENHLILPTYEAVDEEEKYMLAEQRLMQAVETSKSSNCGGIIIQTVKGLVGSAQVYSKGKSSKGAKPFNESEMATRAILLEKYFNRIKKANKEAVIIFENHLYAKIGTDYVKDSGARLSTPGGNRLHCESFVRICMKSVRLRHKAHHLIDGFKPQYGLHQFFDVFKNRWSPVSGSRCCDAKFYFNRNPYLVSSAEFDNEETVFKYGVDLGIIDFKKLKNGHIWYKIEGDKEAKKGREAMLTHLISNYDLSYSIYLQLMKRHDEIYAHHGSSEEKKSRASVVRQGVKVDDVEVEGDDDDED
jgi:RecA/RadA recombinase